MTCPNASTRTNKPDNPVVEYSKRYGQLLFLPLLWLFLPCSAFGLTNFPLVNSAYKYNPNALVQCSHQLASHEDSIYVYLQIKLKEGNLQEDFAIGYEVKDFYGEKSLLTVDSLDIGEFLIAKKEKTYFLKIRMKLEDEYKLLLLNIKRGDDSPYYFDIPLKLENNFNPPNLLLMAGSADVPYFKSYVNSTDTIRIVKAFDVPDSALLFCYIYKFDFMHALPPMATGEEEVSKSMEIDSVFSFKAGEKLLLNNEALYFVQEDTSSLEGVAFRIVDPFYPEFVKVHQLTKPLVYISTRSEYARVKDTDEKKLLDRYWLDLIKTPSRAKTVIKKFYDRIEAANAQFTTYKEGWKTDQGMIYALYGTPDEVYNNGVEEQWIYKRDEEILRVKFTFVKIKNLFTNQHFELMRSKSYEKYWFGNVELWRKGIKDI